MPIRGRGIAGFALAVVCVSGLAGGAQAATGKAAPGGKARPSPVPAGKVKPAKPRVPLSAEEITATRKALFGDNMAAAQAAAKKLGESGAPNATEPLIELLAVGANPALAQDALVALEKLQDAKAIQILTLYAGNRNVPVRLAALKALAGLRDERVPGTLLERLGDSAPEVRKLAAEALVERKEKRAVERLFKLVARNDAGAASPLGALMSPDDVPRLAELRGRVEDGVIATALGELVKRPDVADRLRLEVVRTLGQIPGTASTAALVEYVASVPENDARPSRQEAQKLVEQRGGGK